MTDTLKFDQWNEETQNESGRLFISISTTVTMSKPPLKLLTILFSQTVCRLPLIITMVITNHNILSVYLSIDIRLWYSRTRLCCPRAPRSFTKFSSSPVLYKGPPLEPGFDYTSYSSPKGPSSAPLKESVVPKRHGYRTPGSDEGRSGRKEDKDPTQVWKVEFRKHVDEGKMDGGGE